MSEGIEVLKFIMICLLIVMIFAGVVFLAVQLPNSELEAKQQCLEHGYPDHERVGSTVYCIKLVNGNSHIKKLKDINGR